MLRYMCTNPWCPEQWHYTSGCPRRPLPPEPITPAQIRTMRHLHQFGARGPPRVAAAGAHPRQLAVEGTAAAGGLYRVDHLGVASTAKGCCVLERTAGVTAPSLTFGDEWSEILASALVEQWKLS